MPSLKIIGILFLATYLLCCQQRGYQYPQNRKIANKNGLLYDSLGYYFSLVEPFDSAQQEFVKDTFWQPYLSANLYAFKEPILFNDYQGKDLYRFLWLRSFHLPMVFTISNSNGKITLNTKQLDRHLLYRDKRYVDDPVLDSYYLAKGYKLNREMDTLVPGKIEGVTVIKADRKAIIMYDSTRLLTKTDWNQFEKLIKEADFSNLDPFYWAGYADGAIWVFEAHTKKGYKYIVRQSPDGKLKALGKMLIDLSGLHEEIY